MSNILDLGEGHVSCSQEVDVLILLRRLDAGALYRKGNRSSRGSAAFHATRGRRRVVDTASKNQADVCLAADRARLGPSD